MRQKKVSHFETKKNLKMRHEKKCLKMRQKKINF